MTHQQNTTQTWTFPGYPTNMDERPDWRDLEGRFSWLRALEAAPQSPVFHAEGNVLIHTRMVTEAMIALEEWQKRAGQERVALYTAAMLHDIGKPACTVIEADGHISSRGHARKGERMARRILWSGEALPEPAPFALREQITALVRLHGLPLQFIDRPDPVRTVIEGSQLARLDQVALLAEADVRGRICADQQELLDRVALFREFCQEQECYTHPRAFADEHSRFTYLQSEHGDPNYAAYDDTRCEVVLVAGLPGVGKDSWIERHLPDWPVISLDSIRRALGISPQDDQGLVAQTAREKAREFLRAQRSFIWNATNLTRMMRRRVIDLALNYHARTRIIYLDAPLADIRSRNTSRSYAVPDYVIDNMLEKLEMPDVTEAHRVEWIEN